MRLWIIALEKSSDFFWFFFPFVFWFLVDPWNTQLHGPGIPWQGNNWLSHGCLQLCNDNLANLYRTLSVGRHSDRPQRSDCHQSGTPRVSRFYVSRTLGCHWEVLATQPGRKADLFGRGSVFEAMCDPFYLRLFSYWQIITDGKARKRPSLTLSELLAPPLPSHPTSIIYELRQRSSSSHVTNGGGTYEVFSHNLPNPPVDRVSLPPTTPLHRPISPNSRNVYRRYAIPTWIKNVLAYAIGRCKLSANHMTSMTIS